MAGGVGDDVADAADAGAEAALLTEIGTVSRLLLLLLLLPPPPPPPLLLLDLGWFSVDGDIAADFSVRGDEGARRC